MSHPFPFAYASGSDPRELINICLNQLDEDNFKGRSLAFVYVSDALANQLHQILQLLRQAIGIKDWVGSLGFAVCVTGKEIYDTPAIAVMLTDLNPSNYRLLDLNNTKAEQFYQDHQTWLKEETPLTGIIHGDPSNSDIPQIIDQLAASLDDGFFTGALTSSQNQFLQICQDPTHGNISGVIFSSKVKLVAGHTQGCSPLGPKHIATRTQQNLIISLDDAPALDVLKEDIGEVLSRDLGRIGGYVFIGLPIKGSDTGDYLVRNLLGVDPDKGILAIGDIVENSDPIMFCKRDGNTATEDMVRMLKKLKQQIGNQAIKGGLYHSCLGRGRHQFGEHSEELQLITQELGEFPLIGFFANGEIFQKRLYGYTGVLTLFV